eukprot:1187870-Prorocentrum_minimum.AAC.6
MENANFVDSKYATALEEISELLSNMSVSARAKQTSLGTFFQPFTRAEYMQTMFGRKGTFGSIIYILMSCIDYGVIYCTYDLSVMKDVY